MKFYVGDIVTSEDHPDPTVVLQAWDNAILIHDYDDVYEIENSLVTLVNAGCERMEELLGDINIRSDMDGWRVWKVGQMGEVQFTSSGKTRHEAIRMCYQQWQENNVTLFGRRIGED